MARLARTAAGFADELHAEHGRAKYKWSLFHQNYLMHTVLYTFFQIKFRSIKTSWQGLKSMML